MLWGALLSTLLLSAATDAASIDSVFKPAKGDTLVYGQKTTITWAASSDVTLVTLQLWEDTPGGLNLQAVEIVPYPFTTANSGSYTWTIPTTVSPGSSYRVQVHDSSRQAPSPAYSGLFSIAEKRGACPPGFTSLSGVDPCLPCDVGHFWVNATFCDKCPATTTTERRGAPNSTLCNVPVVDPLASFDTYYQSFLLGSNAAGLNLEAFAHKTLPECARLCLQDKACKSFDAGNPLAGGRYFQTGDCFLSYDNRLSIKTGSFRTGDRYGGSGATWVDTCSDNSTCRSRYREPVCGSDGRTYSNTYCRGCNPGVTQTRVGECPVTRCSNGTACTGALALTCGQDGRQYHNAECATCNGVASSFGRCPIDFCPNSNRRCGPFSHILPVCLRAGRRTIEQGCLGCWSVSNADILLRSPCPVDTCADGSACPGSADDATLNPVCGVDTSATYWDAACAACNQQTRTYAGACSGGVTQLDLYEIPQREPIRGVYFIRHKACLIVESDEGGLHESAHSPEACAQLCLNDVNCKSYDAGAAASTLDDCFLSYDSIASAGSAFQCGDATYDLYERLTPSAFSMSLDYDAVVGRDWTQREALAQSVLAALRAIPGIPNTLDIPIRIVADTVAPGAAPRTVVVFNVESDAALLSQHPNFRQAVKAQFQTGIVVRLNGVSFPGVAFDTAVRCPAGHASQTGFAPRCERCPVDTYANGAQTVCLACTVGTQSPPGSASVLSCRKAVASAAEESLLFTYGSEWVGSYTTNITDANGTRVAGGGLHLQVVEVTNAPNIRLLGTFDHGEYCDETIQPGATVPVCRDAGRAQFYLRGTVVGDTQLRAVFNGWIGITDRTFRPESIDGVVVVNGDNTVFSGVYGTGTFGVTRRCQASTEVGTFTPADKFVGTYECDRQPDASGAQPKVGEEDIRRFDLFVLSKDALTGKVRALVDFDHAKGPGSFVVEGVYDTKTNLIRLLPVEWQTVHPTNIVARELAGRLSDDGEFFTGQLNLNPSCRCTGINAPSDIGNYGKTCGSWGSLPYDWCYVSAGCTEAIAAPTTGFFLAPCSGIATCTNFRLSRVCAEAVPLCEDGWGAHNFRCYKGFNQTATFAEAAAICAAEEAFLSSVHSVNEARIIEDIQVTQAGLGSPVWLGASKTGATEFVWQDGTFLEYINWDRVNGEPNAAQDCATAVSTAGSASATTGGSDFLWSTEACSAKRAFVCRKPPLGRNRTCACTGEVDAQGLGSFCKAWKDRALPEWCYVSKDCPRAKHLVGSAENLWWAFCAAPVVATTPGPTTTTTTPATDLGCNAANPAEYQSGGQCVPCATAASCTAGEYLDATPCSAFSSPACRACDSTCASCSGAGPRACTSCPSGSLLSTVEKVCRASCAVWEYDAGNGKCEPCDTRCGTCSGPLPTDCTACDQVLGSALFLEPSGACGANCDAAGFWKDRLTFTCKPCASCAASGYLAVACTEFADATCAAVRTCKAGEFQLQAPTATSDRICRVTRTSCLGGQEVAANATASSDLICATCAAGTTDDDGDYRSPCLACAAGTYAGPGTTGTCTQCPVGETDDDSDPATICTACVQGTSFQDLPGQAGACKPLSLCAPGTQPMAAVTTTADVGTCIACPAGLFQPATSVGLCMPWAICGVAEEPSNTPDTSTDRVCTACKPNFFKAGDGSAACAMAAACAAGFEESTAPTLSTDRACSPCDGVARFKAAVDPSRIDGGRCLPVTGCAATEFEVSPPGPNRDRVCRARTACSATQYLATSPLPNQDFTCLPLTMCVVGVQYELAPPSDTIGLGFFTQDRVCEVCSTCPTGLVPDQPCSATSDQTCKGCTTCVLGATFAQTNCQVGQDTVCAPCSVCPAGRFASVGCTPRTDTVCSLFSGCATGQYEMAPGTATSDTVCLPVTTCAAGMQPTQAPSRTSDRVCAPCATGVEFKAQVGNFPCTPVSQCAVGQGLTIAASTVRDRRCDVCAFGTFSDTTDGTRCRQWSPACDPSEVEVVAASASTDRKCLACTGDQYVDVSLGRCIARTVCLPGTAEAQTPLPTANRQCRACSPAAGEFQDQSGQASCKRLSPRCGTGLQEAQAPTASSDRRCETCPVGTFKNFVDTAAQPSNRCKAVTVCPAGQEEGTPATPSSNRACAFCTAGMTFNDAVGGSCRPVAECGAGLELVAQPTSSTDRQCRGCPSGSFKASSANSVACRPWATCAIGTYVSRAGNSTSNQGCTACDGFLQYQDQANQPQCKISNFCPKGQGEDLPSSATAPRRCSPCPSGLFQDNVGPNVVCTVWQSCSAGFEDDLARPPSATKDRTCAPCPTGTFSSSGQACVPYTECLSGQQQTLAGTAGSDRVCQTCPPGSYAPQAGTACIGHTACLESQVESTPPTTSTDRLCSAASSKSGGASGSLPIIIGAVVGALLLIILVVVLAVYFSKRRNNSFTAPTASYSNRTENVAFSNPIYNDDERKNPMYDNAAVDEPGYQDVKPLGGADGYMDVGAEAGGDPNGYLDVAPEHTYDMGAEPSGGYDAVGIPVDPTYAGLEFAPDADA